jgi:hypothetical protein
VILDGDGRKVQRVGPDLLHMLSLILSELLEAGAAFREDCDWGSVPLIQLHAQISLLCSAAFANNKS